MAKMITQDTFNEIVRENVVEFSMTPDEANDEAIKQFEAQGVNLATIIKNLDINRETGKPVLIEAIEILKSYDTAKVESTTAVNVSRKTLMESLEIVHVECKKSIPHRMLASKHDALAVLLNILKKKITNVSNNNESSDTEILEAILKCLNSLTHKMPDIFDSVCLSLAVQLLSKKFKQSIICLTLRWLQKACIMHEINRRNIMKANIIEYLKPFILKNSPEILTEILAICRYLILDDDIRVEFGCSHEHARIIAKEVIIDLTQLLKEYDDTNILADLLLTIGALAVRQEFCASVDEVGGIKHIFHLMRSKQTDARLNREAFKLLGALAGHDAVKLRIVQEGAAPIFNETLQIHMANENVVSSAMACIATLTLRSQENSKSFVEAGLVEMIVEALRNHSHSKLVQRNGAWAIRNMVSRSRDQCEIWLNYGIEELLNAAMSEHPTVQQDIKAALRDLGCNIELKEEWTGTAEKKILNSN